MTFPDRKLLFRITSLVAWGVLTAYLSACSALPGAGEVGRVSPERVAAILASPDRTAADRTNDVRRKPDQLLPFINPQVGTTALDLSAGGGYTTELLARALGSSGRVYGQSQPRDPNRVATPPAAPEGNSHPGLTGTAPAAASSVATLSATPSGPRPSPAALAERQQRLQAAGVAAAPIVAVVQRFETPVPVELATAQLDLATLMFNYHDLGHMGVDRDRMNRAVFQALKPGGVYVIADHAGRPGTGISEAGTLHRVEEDFVVKEVQAAGFKLVVTGGFLRNPNDPRDKNTPNPPQPKDEFVLKFVKP